jgi:hypothetical protein
MTKGSISGETWAAEPEKKDPLKRRIERGLPSHPNAQLAQPPSVRLARRNNYRYSIITPQDVRWGVLIRGRVSGTLYGRSDIVRTDRS